MHINLSNTLIWTLALAGGAVVGLAFGMMQAAARRRYEKLQQTGSLSSEWTVVRGSGRRIIFLLVALAVAQIACPSIFAAGGQWWFSGGVLGGYAVALLRQYRQRAGLAG